MPAAVVAANGLVTSAGFNKVPVWGNCHPRWFCSIIGYTYELVWTTGLLSGKFPLAKPVAPLVLGSNGVDTIAAWYDDSSSIEFIIINGDQASGPFGARFPNGAADGLSISCDATECLIASSTTVHDVYGFVFDLQDRRQGDFFSIAMSPRREHHPRVQSLGNGRFLVAYLSDLPGEERIAGRIVTTRSSRRRATR